MKISNNFGATIYAMILATIFLLVGFCSNSKLTFSQMVQVFCFVQMLNLIACVIFIPIIGYFSAREPKGEKYQ